MQIFSLLKKEIIVLFISVVPFIELRGAIPIGVGMGLSPMNTFLIALLGNLLLVPFLLWILDPVMKFLERWKFFKKILDWARNKVSRKFEQKKEKYGALALFAFVAVPLPGTGAWSGALVSKVFEIPFKESLISICLGVLVAGIIIATLSFGITVF